MLRLAISERYQLTGFAAKADSLRPALSQGGIFLAKRPETASTLHLEVLPGPRKKAGSVKLNESLFGLGAAYQDNFGSTLENRGGLRIDRHSVPGA